MSVSETAPKMIQREAQESVQNLGAMINYLDTHDIGDELEAMPEVDFQISLPPRQPRFALEAACQRGIPAEALLNHWVREKAESEAVRTG